MKKTNRRQQGYLAAKRCYKEMINNIIQEEKLARSAHIFDYCDEIDETYQQIAKQGI